MTTPAEIRARACEDLARYLKKLREKNPAIRSVMMGVAQYWADEADDAVHAHCVASVRDTPLWPHGCDIGWDDEDRVRVDGEYCWECMEDFGWMPFDDNGSAIEGFEDYCTEDASQEEPEAHNHRPYAVARLGEDGEITVEVVGVVRRPGNEMLAEDAGEALLWPAPRGASLFAAVCASPEDDGPRMVLADHLQEQGDPRGEYIAVVLNGGDPARRDELFEHHSRWIAPLAHVIPVGGAWFSRGFLTAVDVYVTDAEQREAVRGADAWGTVETLHYLPGSLSVLGPEMVALRDLGVARAGEIEAIVRASTLWAIETLRCEVDGTLAGLLAGARTLPKLRHLALVDPDEQTVATLATAAWWGSLSRVTLLRASGSTRDWTFHPALLELETLAIGGIDELDRPAGWQLAFRRGDSTTEVSMVGYHPAATFAMLAELLATSPRTANDGPVRLSASKWYRPIDADAARLAEATGRHFVL